MKTAKAWGLTPEQWRRQPEDDQAMMVAFEMFEGTRDSYRTEFCENWHKKNDPDRRREGDREFRGMQRARELKRRGHDL